MASRISSHRHLLSRLQAEWRRLDLDPGGLAQARSWGLTVAFDSLGELLAHAGMRARDGVESDQTVLAPGDAVSGDGVLTALLGVARTDDLAARLVLQRLLPGLSALARAHGAYMRAQLDAFDELLSVVWGVIRTFDVERRQRHVAANLLRDCEYRAFVRERRRAVVHELTDDQHLDLPVEQQDLTAEPFEELIETVLLLLTDGPRPHAALEEVDRLVLGTLLTTRNVREAARNLAVTERTVRNHRDALVHRLRAAVAA